MNSMLVSRVNSARKGGKLQCLLGKFDILFQATHHKQINAAGTSGSLRIIRNKNKAWLELCHHFAFILRRPQTPVSTPCPALSCPILALWSARSTAKLGSRRPAALLPRCEVSPGMDFTFHLSHFYNSPLSLCPSQDSQLPLQTQFTFLSPCKP